MILKIVGVIWMISPVLIFLVPGNNVGELMPYAATSFILGLLCFNAASKQKRKTIDKVNPKRVHIITDKTYNRKLENEDHEGFTPRPLKSDKHQSNYSESIKIIENIGKDNFRRDANKGVCDLIRTGKEYPGETSRVLTETYFGIGYVKSDRIESMENLISFRTAFYSYLGLNECLPDDLAIEYYNNFPMVILCLTYFENHNIPEKREFFEKYKYLIYKIIETEHIKIAERMKMIPVVSECPDDEINKALNKISNSFLETKYTNGSSEYEMIKHSALRGVSKEQYIEIIVAVIDMELEKDILENEKLISDMPFLASSLIDTSIENSVEIIIRVFEKDMHNLQLSKREIEDLVITASEIVKLNYGIK